MISIHSPAFRAILSACAAVALVGCGQGDSRRVQGYIEGEFVYVASPLAGALETLSTQRGAQVSAGDPLFALECASERAAKDLAQRRLDEARASLEDIKKGRRPSEIQSIESQIAQTRASADYSEKEMARQEQLLGSAATTQQEVDRARSSRDQDRHHLAQLDAELETAKLGSRPDQIAAQESEVRALEAALAKADWDLSQKRQAAPQSGLVFDTLYRQGEWVASGRPVVQLLPPGGVKLRVFVPETWLGGIHVSDTVEVFADGAPAPVTGRVNFISPQAEYTPPVIYSRENREKFVFRVEAAFEPAAAALLHPGQPVDVRFNPSSKP